MYRDDVPDIVQHITDEGPGGTLTAGVFVLCTIQTPLSRVGIQMEDVRKNGQLSSSLWGHKRNAYHHLRLFQHELHDLLLTRSVSRSEALYRLLACCGLGLPKAAFLMQLHGWNTSCIDVHNMNVHGISVAKVPQTLKPDTKYKKIDEYLEMCDAIGDSEYFWDSWCDYVAGNRMNKSLPTAEAVSVYHKECICGEA